MAPTRSYPRRVAVVVEACAHGHRTVPPASFIGGTTRALHILVPYDLRRPDTVVDEGEVQNLLCAIFPRTKHVEINAGRSHLTFHVHKLPRSPRPLRVGGLPIAFVDRNVFKFDMCFERAATWSYGGNLEKRACRNFDVLNLTGNALRVLIASLNLEFRFTWEGLSAIQAVELIYTAAHIFYVVVPDDVEVHRISMMEKLPGYISSARAYYLNNERLRRPDDYRDRPPVMLDPNLPAPVFDDTFYKLSRPGVMIGTEAPTTHRPPDKCFTTSGVLVKDRAGNFFITVASHDVGHYITHPRNGNRIVGTLIATIRGPEIGLVRLHNVLYTNTTFESPEGIVPKFTRLGSSSDRLTFEPVCLNSPFTGHLEGNVVMHSVKITVPPGSTSSPRYVLYQWQWMGQGPWIPPQSTGCHEGVNGSAIWNDGGVVVGLYQYVITQGFFAGLSVAVHASHLADAGFTLVWDRVEERLTS